MANPKSVDVRTLAFMQGPFELDGYTPVMRDSTFREGEKYEVGLQLTLSGPNGSKWSVLLPKGGRSNDALLYHRFGALLNEQPGTKYLNFTWDGKNQMVIISGAAPKKAVSA